MFHLLLIKLFLVSVMCMNIHMTSHSLVEYILIL